MCRALTGRCGPGSHAALVQGWTASAPAPTCSTAVLDRNALVSVQERPDGRVSRPCRFILVARLGPRKAEFYYFAPNASPFATSGFCHTEMTIEISLVRGPRFQSPQRASSLN